MTSPNPIVNSIIYNDAKYNHLIAGDFESDRSLRLAIQPDSNITAEYIFKGRVAYNDALDKLMYCDGFVWVNVGNGTVTQINTGTGLTGGPITTTGTISLANTTVVAGSYILSSITVNAQGQITSAANGVVAHDASLQGNGVAGNELELTDQAVTPGTYSNAEVTVNGKGIVTAISASNLQTDYSVDWMTNQGVGVGLNSFNYLAPDATYNNKVNANLNATTGVYTAPVSGWYHVSVNVFTSNTGNPQLQRIYIEKTDALATGKNIGGQGPQDANGGVYMSANAITYLNAGNTVVCGINNTVGAVTVDAHVSMTFIGF